MRTEERTVQELSDSRSRDDTEKRRDRSGEETRQMRGKRRNDTNRRREEMNEGD